MRIGLGSDQNAYQLKEDIKMYITSLGFEVKDYGSFAGDTVDYPDIAFNVAEGVLENKIERGILFCGTGIGMAIAANKVPGIRAAQVTDNYSAERAQLSNNAQIISIGAKVTGIEVAKQVVKEYLGHTYEESPSGIKIAKITAKEQEKN